MQYAEEDFDDGEYFDPKFRDDEFDETFEPVSSDSKQTTLPENVKQFIKYFYRHIKEKNVYDIFSMYENSYNKLTETYFKQIPWPSIEVISPLVNNDEIFVLLYKELYYRHIYARLTPTLEHRAESWKNYCDFFAFLLSASPDLDLDLPSKWLWDMIDEFIFQFQSFCQYRSKLKGKPSVDEVTFLANNPQVWHAERVIHYLQAVINKSGCLSLLAKEQSPPPYALHPLYRNIGYFCLVGLLRVQCLLGDYTLALQVIGPVEASGQKGLFTQVIACHVTLYYYIGFTYLMLRRYSDASRTLATVLLYLSRTKQYHTRSYQYEQILKKTEQMYALLAVCLSLSPQRVDEAVHASLREKYSDKMLKMQRGDEATYEELFVYACPKFVSPAPPSFGEYLANPSTASLSPPSHDSLRVQTKLFLTEVKQQSLVPTIRSFLKLYTTIPTQKLSDFLELDEKAFRTQLLCFKHKTLQLVWNGGEPLQGEWTAASDVDFSVDQSMVHISDAKEARRYSDIFLRHINKFEEIIQELEKSL